MDLTAGTSVCFHCSSSATLRNLKVGLKSELALKSTYTEATMFSPGFLLIFIVMIQQEHQAPLVSTSRESCTELMESLLHLIIANTLQGCCSYLRLKNEKTELPHLITKRRSWEWNQVHAIPNPFCQFLPFETCDVKMSVSPTKYSVGVCFLFVHLMSIF